jgi:hypothetical protein
MDHELLGQMSKGMPYLIKSETPQDERKNMHLTEYGLRFPTDIDLAGIGGSSSHR